MTQEFDVKRSMIYSLFGRALYYKNNDLEIENEITMEIFNGLKEAHADFLTLIDETARIGCAARAKTVDIMLKEFIKTCPSGIIMNLGAGFDNHYDRIDKGNIIFFNLDVPDAINFRKEYIADSPQRISISSSMFDYSWLNKIPYNASDGGFIFASGVLHYFKESMVKDLFRKLTYTFPGCEMFFDVVTRKGKENINRNIQKMKEEDLEIDSEIEWFLDNGLELCKTNEELEFIQEFSFSEKLPNGLKLKKQVENDPFFNSKSNNARFIHLKVKST